MFGTMAIHFSPDKTSSFSKNVNRLPDNVIGDVRVSHTRVQNQCVFLDGPSTCAPLIRILPTNFHVINVIDKFGWPLRGL